MNTSSAARGSGKSGISFFCTDPALLAVTDFSLHTLGVIFLRNKKVDEYLQFVHEDIQASGIRVISLAPEEYHHLARAAARFGLDFDDAYQYAVAEQHDLTIVSFDQHFDQTKKGRKEPKDIVR